LQKSGGSLINHLILGLDIRWTVCLPYRSQESCSFFFS